MKCLVLDYGGTALKYGVMDDRTKLEHQGEVPAPYHSVEEFVRVTGEIYDSFADVAEGIAISFPGVISTETGKLYSGGAYMPILQNQSVYEVLRERCPLQMTIENDGKSGALAEAWKGNLRDCNDGVVIVLGTAVGGGIIKDKRIHRGKNMAAGEFSFIIMGDGNDMMNKAAFHCSTEGLMERAAVIKGARKKIMFFYQDETPEQIRQFEEGLRAKARGTQYPELEMNGFEFFKLLEAGDPDIEYLFEDFVERLRRIIIDIAVIYDPERILIGGGISAQPRLIAALQKAVADTILTDTPVSGIDIQACRYRGAANLYGAMYNYLQQKAPELITY